MINQLLALRVERETLAHRLKRLRVSKGLSQNALGIAAEMQSGGQAIYSVESGKRGMHPDTAKRVAAVLGVTPEYLLFGYQPTAEGELPDIEVYLRQTRKLSDPDILAIARQVRALEAEQLREIERVMQGEADGAEDAV